MIRQSESGFSMRYIMFIPWKNLVLHIAEYFKNYHKKKKNPEKQNNKKTIAHFRKGLRYSFWFCLSC